MNPVLLASTQSLGAQTLFFCLGVWNIFIYVFFQLMLILQLNITHWPLKSYLRFKLERDKQDLFHVCEFGGFCLWCNFPYFWYSNAMESLAGHTWPPFIVLFIYLLTIHQARNIHQWSSKISPVRVVTQAGIEPTSSGKASSLPAQPPKWSHHPLPSELSWD